MKIIDDRGKKDAEEEWHVGDVIEVFSAGEYFLGMIFQDDAGCYRFLNLNEGDTISASLDSYDFLGDLISDIERCYVDARKVNVELHIKEEK